MRAARFHVIKTPFFEPKTEKNFAVDFTWKNRGVTTA